MQDMQDSYSETALRENIRRDFKRFREIHDLKSTWEEREGVVELAFRIIKEDMLLTPEIEKRYNEKYDAAKKRMENEIKLYNLFRDDFNRIGCADLIDIIIKYGIRENIESVMTEYLRTNNKETTLKDEEMIIKRSRQIIHNNVVTPAASRQNFSERLKYIDEWKRKKIELSKIVNRKIAGSKFKDFFYNLEREKLKKIEWE